jgi:hypothetical protein
MQNGSMIRAERQHGPDVWEFRWREPGADGKRKHRRMVVGSTDDFVDEPAARQAITGLHLHMNSHDEGVKARLITISELVDHDRQRELKPDTLWKTQRLCFCRHGQSCHRGRHLRMARGRVGARSESVLIDHHSVFEWPCIGDLRDLLARATNAK